MSAHVWPYSRAECDDRSCGWVGPLHLSESAAQAEADQHAQDHAQAAQVEEELLGRYRVEEG